MPGDGVSLTTTLSQMGSVAKTQAKGMQHAQSTTPFADQRDKQDELRVQRVQDTKEQENRGVDPDAGKQDKRQRRRARRQKKLLEVDATAEGTDETSEDEDENRTEALGSLVDLRA